MEKTKPQLMSMMKKISITKKSTFILLFLLLLSSGSGFYFYKKSTEDPQMAAQRDVQDIVLAVSKLIILPTDEIPTLATVSDPEKLRDQVFFRQATKGDKVLIYSNAGKAVLYNPSLNKIIEVSRINIPE